MVMLEVLMRKITAIQINGEIRYPIQELFGLATDKKEIVGICIDNRDQENITWPSKASRLVANLAALSIEDAAEQRPNMDEWSRVLKEVETIEDPTHVPPAVLDWMRKSTIQQKD